MSSVAQRVLLAGLLTLPWLWPFTAGPVAVTQPYLASAALAALTLLCWPVRDRDGAVQAVAAAWLAAAVASSVIALLQYFDLEAALYPWVNIAQPGQAFGNLRQPNQLASLLVMGAWALRWWVQVQRLPTLVTVALGALLMAALAATASRVGLVALLGGGRWRCGGRCAARVGRGGWSRCWRWRARWARTRWRRWPCRGWRSGPMAWPGATCWSACARPNPPAAAG